MAVRRQGQKVASEPNRIRTKLLWARARLKLSSVSGSKSQSSSWGFPLRQRTTCVCCVYLTSQLEKRFIYPNKFCPSEFFFLPPPRAHTQHAKRCTRRFAHAYSSCKNPTVGAHLFEPTTTENALPSELCVSLDEEIIEPIFALFSFFSAIISHTTAHTRRVCSTTRTVKTTKKITSEKGKKKKLGKKKELACVFITFFSPVIFFFSISLFFCVLCWALFCDSVVCVFFPQLLTSFGAVRSAILAPTCLSGGAFFCEPFQLCLDKIRETKWKKCFFLCNKRCAPAHTDSSSSCRCCFFHAVHTQTV